jgi:hypothetical protein
VLKRKCLFPFDETLQNFVFAKIVETFPFSRKELKLLQKTTFFKAATHSCFCLTHVFAKTFRETNIFQLTKSSHPETE